MLDKKRLTVVAGHYGSGKSEFAMNLACRTAEAEGDCLLCDLDVVTPYFRVRDQEEALKKAGVTLVAPHVPSGGEGDIPALPAALLRAFQDKSCRAVIDLGGDPGGARVLARFASMLERSESQVLLVLNANRPETATAEQALSYAQALSAAMGVAFTGIVSNTHLCGETGEEDLLRGAALSEELSRRTGLPVVCHAVTAELVERAKAVLQGPLFPLRLYLKKPWEVDQS